MNSGRIEFNDTCESVAYTFRTDSRSRSRKHYCADLHTRIGSFNLRWRPVREWRVAAARVHYSVAKRYTRRVYHA